MDIWNDVTGDDAAYPRRLHDCPEWWDLYLDTGAWISQDYGTVNVLWRDFLRAFWLNSQEDDWLPRTEWYDEADVNAQMIDWEEWREIKKTP